MNSKPNASHFSEKPKRSAAVKSKQQSNKSSSFKLPAFFATLALISACSPQVEETQQQQIVHTVKLSKVTDIPSENQRTFPAEVSAVKTIDVSFEVTGRLSELNLRTGSQVKKGELLAQIDQAPFKRRVKEAQARLNQAQRDLERITSTFNKGLSSQSQLDNAKTNYELAEIALNNAKQDLSYTKLTAPFDAQVSERFVENNSYVRSGDSIAKLQDISRLFFNINVPERLLSTYKQGSMVKASAHSVTAPDTKYDLQYVEHSTTPDPITQTYKAVFAASATPKSQLVTGTRAIVEIVTGGEATPNALIVPFTAVQGNHNEGFHLWKYSSENNSVEKRHVQVLKVDQGFAAVIGELALNDLVVSAGAAKMRDGLTVKPYQAER